LFTLQHIFKDIPQEKKSNPEWIKEIFIFGHSHRPLNQQVGDRLYFNPGSAGPRRFNLPVTVGRITLNGNSVEGRILKLE